jgi:hypothetical protein
MTDVVLHRGLDPSRVPNAQSGGIHRKESQTVYSDLADRIDTSLYGRTEYYQMFLPTSTGYPRG